MAVQSFREFLLSGSNPTVEAEVNLDQASWQVRQALANGRAAMTSAASGMGLTPQGTPARIGDMLKAWSKAVRQVRSDKQASNAVRKVAEDRLRQDVTQALGDLRQRFDESYEAYRAKLTPPAPDIAADEHMILWARIERQLNAGLSPSDIAADADAKTLAVMASEIKAWRRSQTPKDLRSADQIAAGDLETIHQRRYEVADAAERARFDAAKATERGEYRVRVAFAQATSAVNNLDDFMTGDGGRPVVLPEWAEPAVTEVTL